MSQRGVERVIGRLVTDEEFRRRFDENREAAIREIAESGVELTCVEMRALASIDPRLMGRIADAIDPRIHKIDTCRGRS